MIKILRTSETYILYATVFLFPLAVVPISPNPFVVPKLAVLVFGVSLVVLLKAVRGLRGEKLEFTIGSFDLPLILLAVAFLASTFFIPTLNKMDALLLPGTATAVFTGVFIYFLSNQLESQEKRLLPDIMVISAAFSALINILAATGLLHQLTFLPAYMKTTSFSLEGSFLPVAIYLVTLLPLGVMLTIKSPAWVKKTIFAVASGIMLVNLSIAIFYLTSNQLYRPDFPDIPTSWAIAIDAIKVNPLLGAGPGNYLTAFNRFRPLTFNQSNLWAVKFGTAHDFYMTLLTEVGVIGALAFVLVFVKTYKLFTTHATLSAAAQKEWVSRLPQLSLVLLLLALALFPATLTLIVLLCLLLSFVSEPKVISLRLTSQAPQDRSGMAQLLSSSRVVTIGALLSIIALPVILYKSARMVYAEYIFSQALQSVSKNDAKGSYDLMRKSLLLNPQVDRYHLTLSQLNLGLAKAIAKKGNLSDADRTIVTQLIQQAIEEGKAGVALNPQRAGNWENLGRIYLALAPLAKGADSFAIQSYQQAVALDPFDPNLRIALGGLFVATKNNDQAVRTLELAVLTKPDHPNARYNLSFALKEKGDIEAAITQMKQVLQLVQPTSPDYELAKKELENLEKNRPSPKEAEESTGLTQPPQLEETLKPPIELGEENKPPEPAASPAPDISPAPQATGSATPSTSPAI